MSGAMQQVNTVLTVILVILGGLMTFLIMLQERKGGGLAALGGTKAAGIEGVTNPIRRATAYMAGLFFILACVLGIMNRPTQNNDFMNDPDKEAKAAEVPVASVPAADVRSSQPIEMPEFPTQPVKAAGNLDTKPTATVTAPVTIPAKAVDKTPEAPKPDAVKPETKAADAAKVDAPKVAPATGETLKTPPIDPNAPKNDILKPNSTNAPVDKK
jgi:protein translocase SecG subunit